MKPAACNANKGKGTRNFEMYCKIKIILMFHGILTLFRGNGFNKPSNPTMHRSHLFMQQPRDTNNECRLTQKQIL